MNIEEAMDNLIGGGPLLGTPESLAKHLHEIRLAKQLIAEHEQEVEALLVKVMPTDVVLIPKWGHIERKRRAKSRTWDSDALTREILQLARSRKFRRVDKKTGEIESPEECAVRLLAECGGLTNPSAPWRKTHLQALGIPVPNYVTVKPGRRYVEIVK